MSSRCDKADASGEGGGKSCISSIIGAGVDVLGRSKLSTSNGFGAGVNCCTQACAMPYYAVLAVSHPSSNVFL